MQTNKKPNRLIHEKSPYLLQHAYNPVDWYPWGDEAFEKAKAEKKPVFISIGYSTCHWCHVMERESFEDEEVAKLLNDHFVSIKVDREERPDIDSIYMDVCIKQNGEGGWPLNGFLMPDQTPFYMGTYFPKESKYGRPGMMDILPQLHDLYVNNPEKIKDVGERMKLAIQPKKRREEDIPAHYPQFSFTYLSQTFDPHYGGFGTAPKFPTPGQLLFLLRYFHWKKEDKALDMVVKTLNSMANGGIYDHIGYGFARYSTDEIWLVPHFEKMLYDNALLMMAYTEAYQITKNDRFKDIVFQTAEYIEREMTSPEGGFYSALDADSEGAEGTYYLWTEDEVYELLGEEDADIYTEVYDISQRGNFEGKNIPNLVDTDLQEMADEFNLSLDDLKRRLEEGRLKLLEYRSKRTYPHLDDKILTSWNGLCIAALGKAGAVFGERSFTEMAVNAETFIRKHLWKEDFLLARYRDGEAKYKAYLDDYAFLLWGYLELNQSTGELNYLQRAQELADILFNRFEDEEQGGFYFTDVEAEKLLIREKTVLDGALPSGNGVVALQLWRLAKLTGDFELMKKVENMINAFSEEAAVYTSGVLSLLSARIAFEIGGKEIVISGTSTEEKLEIMRMLQTEFHPYDVWVTPTEGQTEPAALIEGKVVSDRPLAVFICENSVCHSPVFEISEVNERLI